jgi:hypothetical protein
VGFVRAARWVVVVKDCCHCDAQVDYLLCDEHRAMIRHQQLPTPERLRSCRTVSDAVPLVDDAGECGCLLRYAGLSGRFGESAGAHVGHHVPDADEGRSMVCESVLGPSTDPRAGIG